jgi:serine/threonine protein kinase
MEYAEFGSVGSLIEGNEMDGQRTIYVLCQTLSALKHLHNLPEPIVHRDLKPGNILVASLSPFVVKMADFGLAKLLLPHHDSMKSNVGTCWYMAPEIGLMARYTPVVDIWSLGVVVLQLWRGFPAAEAPLIRTHDDRARWCELLADTTAKTAAQLSSLDVDRLLARMLRWEPKRRQNAAECLQDANDMEKPAADGVLDSFDGGDGQGAAGIDFRAQGGRKKSRC